MTDLVDGKILALDLGSYVGYSILQPDGAVLSYGTQHFPGDRHLRLAGYKAWITRMATEHQVALVVYERPFARGLHATRSLWGMAGITEACCALLCPVLDQVPSAIKKWATGKGTAKKPEMIEAAAKMLGINPNLLTEHEADAILLGRYTVAHVTKG
jgi:Holliday junction resolvasome RuvABC endonuclease subunit